MAQLRQFGQGLIDPTFCCCAVPTVNAGIYGILMEQAIVGIGIAVAAFVTQDIIGASIPSFTVYIFAITCLAVTIVQPIGFIGVLREKTKTFKFYSLLNGIAVACAFICGAILIVISALRHTTAVNDCVTRYFKTSNSTTAMANTMLQNEGPLLCGPFAWADVGIMGGLWVVLLLLQGYFIYITRTYSVSQVSDHKLYHSVYSENPEAFTMSVLRSSKYNPGSVYNAQPPMAPGLHADPWDSRPSMDSQRGEATGYGYGEAYGDGGYNYAPGGLGYGNGHQRGESYASDHGKYDDAYGDGGMGYAQHQNPQQHQQQYQHYPQYNPSYDQSQGTYPPQQHSQDGGYPFVQQGGGYVEHPAEAHAGRDPGQTPTMNTYQEGSGVGYSAGNAGLRRPDDIKGHPAEGMFGRKSPRMR